jgi:hypothetical protein
VGRADLRSIQAQQRPRALAVRAPIGSGMDCRRHLKGT